MNKDIKSVHDSVRSSSSFLEEYERRIATLRNALIEGERSGLVEYDTDEIRRKAQRRVMQRYYYALDTICI